MLVQSASRLPLLWLFAGWMMLVVPSVALARPDSADAANAKPKPLDAWAAVAAMSPGINIGNTLENTHQWETGWGNPPITREYVQQLARLGFKCVRLPVAWDTYAKDGRITPEKFRRVNEVVDWIAGEGMYCVINIHWDGGWIDSDVKERYPQTYHTFSAEAEKKFTSYWQQIADHFKDKGALVVFEAFNEESSFNREPDPYATLNRVNQLFVDIVRRSGGNNADRLLIIAGYTTDIDKTCRPEYRVPTDTVANRLLLSVHYYTPFQFVGLKEDASWGKMIPTWGTEADYKQLNELFDRLSEFCKRNNTPAFIGEFSMCADKDRASSVRWTSSVYTAALSRQMVPVLWDTGGAISRHAPYTPAPELIEMLKLSATPSTQPSK